MKCSLWSPHDFWMCVCYLLWYKCYVLQQVGFFCVALNNNIKKVNWTHFLKINYIISNQDKIKTKSNHLLLTFNQAIKSMWT